MQNALKSNYDARQVQTQDIYSRIFIGSFSPSLRIYQWHGSSLPIAFPL